MGGRQGDYVEALRRFLTPKPVKRAAIAEYLRAAYPHHADDNELRPGPSKTPVWMHDMDWALQKLKAEGVVSLGRGWWHRP